MDGRIIVAKGDCELIAVLSVVADDIIIVGKKDRELLDALDDCVV